MTIETKSKNETLELARLLGEDIARNGTGPFVIALEGELGAGKTTFIRGLAKGLGLARRIVSPTFLMARRYRLRSNPRKFENFYHVDAYRMRTARDLEVTGVAEALRGGKNIVAVEWANLIKRHLPADFIVVKIKHKKENERVLSITAKGKGE